MFDFIVATNQGTEDHHITGASLYDEDGQVIGGVVFFAHKDMTLTSGEVVRPFSGKLNSVTSITTAQRSCAARRMTRCLTPPATSPPFADNPPPCR